MADDADDLTPVYQDAGQRYGVDPALLEAQTHVESHDNDYAVSDAGAMGRSQFIPSTAARMGLKDPYDPREAIPMQAKLLRENMDRFGRPDMAIAAYHGGSDPGSWGPKTRDYLEKVGQAYAQRRANPPPAPKEADDWVVPQQQSDEADDWITPGQPKASGKLQFNEGHPLTSREAVKQLPMAQTEDLPPPAAEAPTHSETPTFMEAVGQKAREAYTSTPPLIEPEGPTGRWLSEHGMGGLTQPIVPLAAVNAGLAGAGEAAVQATKRYVGEAPARGVGELIDYAMTGAPELTMGPHGHGEAIREEAAPVAPGGTRPLTPEPQATPQAQAQHSDIPTPEAAATGEQPPEAAPRSWEQEALDELDPDTQRTVAKEHASLAKIAESEGIKLPEKPPAPEQAILAADEAKARAEGLQPVTDEKGNWIGYERAEVGAAPAETTKDLPESPGATLEGFTPAEPEVAQPPNDARGRLAEVSEREAEISKQEEQPPPASRETPFEKLPREPMRLTEWLKQNGGIQDTGGDLKAILGGAKGRPGLINKRGATLDDAAQGAWQAGYLPDASRPDTNALLDAIRDDHIGTKRYSDQDYDRVQEYQAAVEGNTEVDRLAAQHGIETQGRTRDQFYDELHDRMSTEEQAREIQEQEAAALAAKGNLEQGAREYAPEAGLAPSPRDFYGQSQARTLRDLEDEYRQEKSAADAKQRPEGAERPPPPAPPEGAGEEAAGPYGRAAGDAGRGEAVSPAPGTDLLGRQIKDAVARQPEPTIRNDPRQDVMLGMEGSAAQAQAARDAEGRGALQSHVAQKPADEGLFAPDTSGQGTLYSFPGSLFDPAAWRRLFQQRAAAGGPDILRDKQGISRWAAEFKAGFAPTSLRGAKPMEYVIRRHTGESAQAFDIAANTLDHVRGEIDKLPIAAQVDFTDRMESGQAQPTPELQQVADTLRKTIDDWAKKVQGLGRGYLANAIENYMGHIWGNYREWSQGLLGGATEPLTQAQMQAAATARNVGKAPLRGSGAFLKQRKFPTQRDGIDAGLVPATYNPIDLQLIKLHEMQKFYYGTKLADQIKQTGLAHWIKDSDVRNAAHEGLVELNDSVFQPRLYGVHGAGPVEPGKWMAPEPMARIFNNYMSQGWSGRSAIYDGLRKANNGLNSLQLGLSGFHAAFVMNDTATSKVALGIQQTSRADLGRGVGNVLFGTAGYPGAVVQTVRKGAEFRRAWLDPAGASPQMKQIVDAAKAGGFRMSMPDFFRTSESGTFFRHIADLKHPQSAFYQAAQMFKDAPGVYQKAIMTPLRIAARVLDTLQEPLMGALVPRAKAGVFYDLAADWMRRNPGASTEEMSAAMTEIQDSVDNRLGQLNYDNVFWNKTAKDIAFITTRSVGWNLGTFRELGGAVVDGGSFLKDIGNGRWPKITTRIAYAIAMPVVTAELGAMLTYLSTGRAAQGWDYFYPPSGSQDAAGNEERRNIPGYMKDVIAFRHAPMQTFINKQSPMLSAMSEVFTGKDYYGGSIYDPQHDSGPAQAYADFLINQAMPFSVSSFRRSEAQGQPALDQALNFFGFQEAPKYITAPMKGEAFQHREAQKAFKARVKATQQGRRVNIFNSPGG